VVKRSEAYSSIAQIMQMGCEKLVDSFATKQLLVKSFFHTGTALGILE